MLPNFIIIGGQRCATGWLAQCLGEHPEIFIPRGETRFFDLRFSNGPIWWEQKFFSNVSLEKAVGEKTANYLTERKVPDRILKTTPNAKLICCLRNPIERLNSALLMMRLRDPGLKRLPVREAIKRHPDLVARGMYFSHLKRYFDRFPAQRILVTFYDERQRDPVTYIRQVLIFLGVSPNYVSDSLYLQTKPGAVENTNPAWRWLGRTLGHRSSPLRGLYSSWRPAAPTGVLSKDDVKYLKGIYMDETLRLGEYLNKDLSGWIEPK